MDDRTRIDDDGAPVVPMTYEGLDSILKRGHVAIGSSSTVEPDDNRTSAAISLPLPAPTHGLQEPPAIPIFGTPSSSITTEQILGHPLLPPAPAPPPPPDPQPDMPTLPGEVGAQKKIDDALTRDRAKAEREAKDPKRKAEFALGSLMRDHPGTKLINVQLLWRDPTTGEYRKKGRRKNVSANEVRDPESFCIARDGSGVHYGGNWIMGYMPADQGKLFDDPKVWYWFEFDRDGPEPPREWTIDQPFIEPLFVEVEGMGQIPIADLKSIVGDAASTAAKQAVAEALGKGGTPPPGTQPPPQQPAYPQGYPQGYQPGGYPQGYPGYPGSYQPLPTASRDLKAEEREKKLEEALEEQRKLTAALMQRLNESDRKAAEDRAKIERDAADARAKAERDAADARHAAELAALKAGFQSTVDQTTRALEAVTAKLSSVEQRVNQPPPSPPPPQDNFAALNTLKEIFVGNRQAESEVIKAREAALAEERRREKEEHDRRREEERVAREREREEVRERREREREEERARREAADRADTQARELARQSLDQYRMMGEQSMNSARAIAEITGKQQDPAPVISMMNAMAQQTGQSAQILLTLFKTIGQGGGGGGGANWPELIAQLAPDAFRAVSDVGAAFAEASAAKAKAAAQTAVLAAQTAMGRPAAFPPQQPVVIPRAPAPPSMAGMQQPQPQPQARPQAQGPAPRPVPPPRRTVAPAQTPQQAQMQPTPTTSANEAAKPSNPLSSLIAGVNQAIGTKEKAEKVAGKIAAIVRVAQEFGTTGSGKKVTGALRSMMDDPLNFLQKAYPSSDPEYLELIAKILLENYSPEGDESANEGKDETENTENAETGQTGDTADEDQDNDNEEPSESVVAFAPMGEPTPPAPKPEPTEAEMLVAMRQPQPPPAPVPMGPTEAEMLAAMRAGSPTQTSVVPAVSVVIRKPRPKPTEALVTSEVVVSPPVTATTNVPIPVVATEAGGNGTRRARTGSRRAARQVPLPIVAAEAPKPVPAVAESEGTSPETA